MKRLFVFFLFVMMVFVSNAQNNMIHGKWYLQEVQIPSTEEYVDGILYDKNKCIILISNEEGTVEWVSEDVDVDVDDWETGELVEENVNPNYYDTVDWSGEIEVDLDCESSLFELFNDTVLVLNPRYGVYDVYVIKMLTSDLMVLATDRTLSGYTLFAYGRTKQPIKHSKHYIVRNRNDRYPNSIVYRLSPNEVVSNRTPASVAYNFVYSILNNDVKRMLSNMDEASAADFERERLTNGFVNYAPFFSEKGSKLNIMGWKPYLDNNCEVVVSYVQNEWFDEHGREIKKVYVECVPSNEVGVKGFQDITSLGGTNVKVLVANENGKWRVIGFK